jgi:hypothetical protein
VTLGETVQAWAEEARSKGAATFPLIRPLSVNNLFENRRGKGRVRTRKYYLWRADQMGAIMAAGPRLLVSGPVDIFLMGAGREPGRLGLHLEGLTSTRQWLWA